MKKRAKKEVMKPDDPTANDLDGWDEANELALPAEPSSDIRQEYELGRGTPTPYARRIDAAGRKAILERARKADRARRKRRA